jgi:hypothetical protein
MSDLRDVLRETAANSGDVDLDSIRARVDRRRRTRRVVTSGCLALAVVGGVVATVQLVGGDDPAAVRVVTPAPDREGGNGNASWSVPGVQAVAVGPAGTWITTREYSDADGETRAVARIDTTTGELSSRIELPGPVTWIAVGDGVVWAWGGGDGAEPVGHVFAIDAARGAVLGEWIGAVGYRGLVPELNHAWVASTETDEVVLLGATAQGIEVQRRVPVQGRPAGLVYASDGHGFPTVWVQEPGTGTIAGIDTESQTVTARHAWSGALLASDGNANLWLAEGGQRVVNVTPALLDPGTSLAIGARLDAPGAFAAAQGRGGLYVATPGGISWFAHDALASGVPTASRPLGGVSAIAVDYWADDHPVLYTLDNRVALWQP